MLSEVFEVFVNIKAVLQNHSTQCRYWLNFFFKSLYACTPQAKAPELLTIDIVVVCFQRFWHIYYHLISCEVFFVMPQKAVLWVSTKYGL